MKTLQKYFPLILCTFFLILIAVYVDAKLGTYAEADNSTKVDVPIPRFCVYSQHESTTKEISVFDSQDGNYYVFLPSYADMEQVTVALTSGHLFSLNDVTLSNGMTCESFELETPYALAVDYLQIGTLWFYQSSNVATMYIDTATGSMTYIHQDKNYEENASITLYGADGSINHYSEENILKGRGNATWDFDKRPYSLTLSAEADLLGMGTAENWVLLANATDETNLNTYIIHQLASRFGFAWTPECRWVDVYLNGEYSGLYLLAEKVEVGNNRLDIDTASGDFLCKIDLFSRWKILRNPFLTKAGRTVEITFPKILPQSDYDNIVYQVNQMEQTILSGQDLSAGIIDLDSWVRRYLIDEISGNIDSDLASSYFYFSDGVFYAGPVWDYDMSLGNTERNQEPHSFIAKTAAKAQLYVSPYYSTLYENESFHNRMVEIYRLEFLPVLQNLVDNEIESLVISISNAAQMNSLRWRSMYDQLQSIYPDTVCTTTDLILYLDRRMHFLNRAWLENTQYHTVQFEFSPGRAYWNVSVERGTCLETTYVDLDSTTWFDPETGEVFDFSQPIMEDMIVTAKLDSMFKTRDYLTFLSIAVLVIMLLGFGIIDIGRSLIERRGTNE